MQRWLRFRVRCTSRVTPASAQADPKKREPNSSTLIGVGSLSRLTPFFFSVPDDLGKIN